jgi:hypothetical protein
MRKERDGKTAPSQNQFLPQTKSIYLFLKISLILLGFYK